ncbi:MAG: asparagine synthase (glutamine-hydrolyzing) [Bacteroidetes bacterium]|nr:asparagine synthase (glutamine-hydrolyzing) [Bacteroidota bacterium]
MCGIAGIVLKQVSLSIRESIAAMALAIKHRGPDGEGFILGTGEKTIPCLRSDSQQTFTKADLAYLPKVKLESPENNAFLAFAHRRLSIIDLSDSGHQPMCSPDEKTWITFNGEIYNYIELRKELQDAGFLFKSESDTEVILTAYRHWGTECVKKFNGMWAFCIYDSEKQICFASRDRLGVKPFYYVDTNNFFSFASEQKAFVKANLINANFSLTSAHEYLINGLIETGVDNFFEGVKELFPGNNLIYSIKDKTVKIQSYYKINITQKNEALSDNELIEKIEARLIDAVKLRLRSDVEVGACLSGGIDSSALCGIMHKVLNKSNYCFTSVFRNETFNEEHYADVVAKSIQAKYFKVEPTPADFLKELDSLVYSQDVPIWDTSTYAQFKVMELAKQHNIKVVIDGQGADELFGGYHHHYVAKWKNLMSAGKFAKAFNEVRSAGKTIKDPLSFYIKEKIKANTNVSKGQFPIFFTKEFINAGRINNSSTYFNTVNEQLLDDIEHSRLKSFLKCEDRCGMWHSVESRTPFSDDVELIDLMFSFNGNRKIKNGVSKYLLREATKNVLPAEVYNRYDKRGFETPMKKWLIPLKSLMIDEINTSGYNFVKPLNANAINLENQAQLKLLFKLFILGRWKKVFS